MSCKIVMVNGKTVPGKSLTASLETEDKKDTFGEQVGLDQKFEPQKRDNEEYEAAQNSEENSASQEEDVDREKDQNLEAAQDESESDEDVDEHLEANVGEADEMSNLDEAVEDLPNEEVVE
ncbi:hypothetical protein DPEC_G00336300 [Dallia pectoralis]|uniref:Uncharacterized protein n=1 Tax=Dallia pectoralis TaxID=75939 RepID=A0ACC2F768_DALPE|nr:hypothetical protein DPEC_G00336300 [Dallia pectoralis]